VSRTSQISRAASAGQLVISFRFRLQSNLDQTADRFGAAGLIILFNGPSVDGCHGRTPRAVGTWSASGEMGIAPRVQFGQIRQAIYRQLLGIALASGRKNFDISANFLP
jgi:hypothetical protein